VRRTGQTHRLIPGTHHLAAAVLHVSDDRRTAARGLAGWLASGFSRRGALQIICSTYERRSSPLTLAQQTYARNDSTACTIHSYTDCAVCWMGRRQTNRRDVRRRRHSPFTFFRTPRLSCCPLDDARNGVHRTLVTEATAPPAPQMQPLTCIMSFCMTKTQHVCLMFRWRIKRTAPWFHVIAAFTNTRLMLSYQFCNDYL